MSWPTTFTINAWTGKNVASGNISAQALAWALGEKPPNVEKLMRPAKDADPAEWRDPRIGWGLILPERSNLSPKELALGDDAPEPIRYLLKERGNAPVFRYRPKSPHRFTLLRNYASGKDIAIDTRTPSGIAPDALPQYLLIYGTPAEIPWDLQYTLNTVCAVGRLDLEGKALENYVQALLNNWGDDSTLCKQAVVAWAVDHGSNDITHLMRNAIAVKVYEKWRQDSSLQAIFLDGSATFVSSADLINTLSVNKPKVVVTTSHGQTGPLDNPAIMRSTLGLLVDQAFQILEPRKLLAVWEPDGAIWYAHACCSAGSDAKTLYDGLVEAGSTIDQVLKGITKLGALTAPLPKALLGAKKPLRAFIGHVEPTFDWTLRQPSTGQHLTSRIQKVLYDNVYSQEPRKPVGLAFRDCYIPIGALYTAYDHAHAAFNDGKNTDDDLLYCQLSARDLQSMVILGDPTATLPPLP